MFLYIIVLDVINNHLCKIFLYASQRKGRGNQSGDKEGTGTQKHKFVFVNCNLVQVCNISKKKASMMALQKVHGTCIL